MTWAADANSTISLALGFFVTLCLNALAIYLATGFVGSRDREFTRALLVAFIGSLVSMFIPPIGIITIAITLFVWLFILKGVFELGWGHAILATILVIVLNTIMFSFLRMSGLLFTDFARVLNVV